MGNQHSASRAAGKPRKNVHWKSAGRPAAPGKPEIIPIESDDEPNAITLRWSPAAHDGGTPLQGYQVECNRLGAPAWLRTAPPVVLHPELVLTGLEPPHRYQFRVAAINAVGRSDYSAISDVLTVGPERAASDAPVFLLHLEDVTALENDKTEFQVTFTGSPAPTIAWFKDGYEIFSSRRTAITTDERSSVLLFHQTLASDEGEIKCTATNRAGHAVSRARLSLEAAPKLRYPRQYEDGLLYEINETVFLKTTIVGKPPPTIEWRHDGQPLVLDDRVEIQNTPKFSILKIQSARRSDRGEYQIHAKNIIGEDTASFLVTVTAPPEPPRRVRVTRQLDKSVTLDWEPPEDDGGCRIGNYVIEYYRTGWNVWLKASTSRKTNVTLFDLIEGSEYRFRVKAESPYGMSAPSAESAPVRIPGRAIDMEFLAVESRIINEVLLREDGQEAPVSPAPRRRRRQGTPPEPAKRARSPSPSPSRIAQAKDPAGSNEFMLVLYPNSDSTSDKAEKRKSFQLDLEDALSPPPISLSAPELSSRCTLPFKALRNAVSSTELLHERAMARFYKAVAMKEEQNLNKKQKIQEKSHNNDIPLNNNSHRTHIDERMEDTITVDKNGTNVATNVKPPEIIIKSDSVDETSESKYNSHQISLDSEADTKWSVSFEDDYTASTVTTDEEYTDEGSLNGDDRHLITFEEDTYSPRDKSMRPSSTNESLQEDEEESERAVKPLPLPDPNFIPKPILKRRESDVLEIKVTQDKPKLIEKPKEEKMNILKKITKMPSQKPFSFPKLLHKKEPKKLPQEKQEDDEKPKPASNAVQDKISDEGRTIIDYYSNIVKEYGGQKKPATTLYLNTEELKTIAEKQQKEKKIKVVKKFKTPTSKAESDKSSNLMKSTTNDKPNNSISKQTKQKPKSEKSKSANVSILENKNKVTTKSQDKEDKTKKQQIILKKAERATVVSIDYQELENRAKQNVRSAIDYMVDVCLLMLAFWVYLFKDERLAIPFLVLIIYRQLQETLLLNIPQWARRHTPDWIKKKIS